MSRHSHLLTAMVLCALPLAACSAGAGSEGTGQADAAPTASTSATSISPPEVPGDGTFPAITDVDRTDVDSTARTTAVLLHSWDTATDRTETAAAIRAKPLLSDEWAQAQVEPQRNSSQGDWLGPDEHRAYSRARAVPSIGDVSHDVAQDKAIRAYTVTWRWASRDGEPAKGTGRRQVVLYLEKHSGAWEVVGHQFTNTGTGEVPS